MKVYIPSKSDEVFVRFGSPGDHPIYHEAVAWLVDEDGDPVADGDLLMRADGSFPRGVNPLAASKADIELDEEGRWSLIPSGRVVETFADLFALTADPTRVNDAIMTAYSFANTRGFACDSLEDLIDGIVQYARELEEKTGNAPS